MGGRVCRQSHNSWVRRGTAFVVTLLGLTLVPALGSQRSTTAPFFVASINAPSIAAAATTLAQPAIVNRPLPILLPIRLPAPKQSPVRVQAPTLPGWSVTPSALDRGNSFTANYTVTNTTSQGISVGLGMSLRRSGTTTELYDQTHDAMSSVILAGQTKTVSRLFTTSATWAVGSYDYVLAIWSGMPGTSTQYSSTGWQSSRTLVAPPTLAGATINPGSGPSGTTFTFKISYTDADGDFPSKRTISVDGGSATTLSETNSSDLNVKDGKDYQFVTSSLGLGSHSAVFRFNDGSSGHTDVTSSVSGPNVTVAAPTLSSSSYVTPNSLDRGSSFTAWYLITNPNSSSISVGLGASIRPVGSSGNGLADPSHDTTVSVSPGIHWYSRLFATSTSSSVGSYQTVLAIWSGAPGTSTQYASTGWRNDLTLTAPPILAELSVDPTSGNRSTSFRYSALYTDPDGDAPSTVEILIDGGSWATMNRDWFRPLEYRYYLNRSLTLGSHSFLVRATDRRGSSTTSAAQSGPTVVNRAPDAATNPTPANGASGVDPRGPTLSWSAASDPDGDAVSYDVQYGSSPSSLGQKVRAVGLSYQFPATLNENVTIFWRLTSVDSYGGETIGPIWNFTTKRIHGTLALTVKNFDWSGATDVPGSSGIVRLYKGSQLIQTQTTVANGNRQGTATFSSLSPDTYVAKVLYPGPQGEEYWGDSASLTINEAQDVTSTFSRRRPAAKDVSFFRDAAHTQPLGSSDTMIVSTPIYASVLVNNPMITNAAVTVDVLLDRDQSGSIDLSSSQSATITGTTDGQLNFTMTPTIVGSYQRAIKVSTDGSLTDGWAWNSAVVVIVPSAPTITDIHLEDFVGAPQSTVVDQAAVQDRKIIVTTDRPANVSWNSHLFSELTPNHYALNLSRDDVSWGEWTTDTDQGTRNDLPITATSTVIGGASSTQLLTLFGRRTVPADASSVGAESLDFVLGRAVWKNDALATDIVSGLDSGSAAMTSNPDKWFPVHEFRTPSGVRGVVLARLQKQGSLWRNELMTIYDDSSQHISVWSGEEGVGFHQSTNIPDAIKRATKFDQADWLNTVVRGRVQRNYYADDFTAVQYGPSSQLDRTIAYVPKQAGATPRLMNPANRN